MDVLLGILYNNIHPVMVHQLSCGVAIYKSRLLSHDRRYNCLIGGPHRSFEMLAGKVGSTAAMLAHFVEGLQKYRMWGPPKLACAPPTLEERLFAKKRRKVKADMSVIQAGKSGLNEITMVETLECSDEAWEDVHDE